MNITVQCMRILNAVFDLKSRRYCCINRKAMEITLWSLRHSPSQNTKKKNMEKREKPTEIHVKQKTKATEI